jgi:predicted metal-dependent hydrolase
MPNNIPYPQAYVAYLAEFYGSRNFFECHEIMEEYWNSLAAGLFSREFRLLVIMPAAATGSEPGK